MYCPHPLGGHVLCYAPLARRLNGRHRAWGLQAKGLAEAETPPASWDGIVEHHWALLSAAARPVDGLALVGYSYGGYIALELAARARRQGAVDVSVVLLDVPHPSVIPDAQRHPDAATLLHALLGHSLGLGLEELQRVPPRQLTRHIYDAAVTARLIPPDTPFARIERLLAVAEAHSRLEPPNPVYDFPIVLIRARDGANRISSLPDLGWTPHVTGLTLEWAAGSHETMLNPENAGDLADLMARHLPAVARPGGSSVV